MDGYTFSVPIRSVRFADTDAQGVAHNSAYVVWFEVARVEYLREFAGGYQALRDQGSRRSSPSRSAVHRPARFDDELVVHTRCVGPRGARFRYEYAIVRGTSSSPTATRSTPASMRTMRPTRFPSGSRRRSLERRLPGRARNVVESSGWSVVSSVGVVFVFGVGSSSRP